MSRLAAAALSGALTGVGAAARHSQIQRKKVEGAWMVPYPEAEEAAASLRLVAPTPTEH